jgi:hypothetical protein
MLDGRKQHDRRGAKVFHGTKAMAASGHADRRSDRRVAAKGERAVPTPVGPGVPCPHRRRAPVETAPTVARGTLAAPSRRWRVARRSGEPNLRTQHGGAPRRGSAGWWTSRRSQTTAPRRDPRMADQLERTRQEPRREKRNRGVARLDSMAVGFEIERPAPHGYRGLRAADEGVAPSHTPKEAGHGET